MDCSRCAKAVEPGSAYCPACGTPVHATSRWGRRLTRRPADGRVAGVCAGIAAYFDLDVTIVRLLWIILSIAPGALIGGAVAYVAAWMLMPESREPIATQVTSRRLMRAFDNRKFAGVCGGLAEYLGIDATLVRVASVILAIYPGAVIFGVLAYAIAWAVIPPAPPPRFEPATV